MKRKNFKIEFEKDGVIQTVIKHAWNAANKEVVSIIRQIARNQGRSTGQKVFFKIEKVD